MLGDEKAETHKSAGRLRLADGDVMPARAEEQQAEKAGRNSLDKECRRT